MLILFFIFLSDLQSKKDTYDSPHIIFWMEMLIKFDRHDRQNCEAEIKRYTRSVI